MVYDFYSGGKAFIVFVNRIQEGRFSDTNKIFAAPQNFDVEVTAENSPEFWAEKIYQKIFTNNN